MPAKIRLTRSGKKRYPYYHIVITDSRAKRDGRIIEKIGSYNPNTNPASIDLNFDRALHWIKVGAQPTNTVRAILSYKGVLMKDHLDRGVLKKAFDQAEADRRFNAWMTQKESKIQAKEKAIQEELEKDRKNRLAEEKAKKEQMEKEIIAKQAALAAEVEKSKNEEVADEVEELSEKTPEENVPETKAETVVQDAVDATSEQEDIAEETDTQTTDTPDVESTEVNDEVTEAVNEKPAQHEDQVTETSKEGNTTANTESESENATGDTPIKVDVVDTPVDDADITTTEESNASKVVAAEEKKEDTSDEEKKS